jgi:hypothetical protein
MTRPTGITFDKLYKIISKLYYECQIINSDSNILVFANDLYDAIYKQIIECPEYTEHRNKVLLQFNDARVYSIHILKRFLIDKSDFNFYNLIIQHYPHTTEAYPDINHYALLTYSHMFVIEFGFGMKECEAISIQISLSLLNANICNRISCGIAKKLFTYIVTNIEMFKCKFLYASAWSVIAKILMEYFGFVQLTQNAAGDNIFKWHRTKTLDGKYVDPIESIIPPDIISGSFCNIRDWLYNLETQPYILTFKKF